LRRLAGTRSFRLGAPVTERWNARVRPRFRARHELRQRTDREGDAAYDTGSTTLYRDGVQVGTFDVPGRGRFTTSAGAGDFRLVAEQTQTSIGALATRIMSEWRFHSTGDGHGNSVEQTIIRAYQVA
jgi:hypothetical protein